MTSQPNSGLACGFVFAAAIIAVLLPGSIRAGTVMQTAPAMEVSAVVHSAAIANLPILRSRSGSEQHH